MANEKTNRVATLQKLENEIDTTIAQANKSLTDGKVAEYLDKVSHLTDLEKDYAETKSIVVFDELRDAENPLVEAIMRYSYPVLRHKENSDKDSHKVVSIEKKEKPRQIDLLKFCKYAVLDSLWQYDAQKFNQLLCLRAAKELKFSPAEIKKVAKSYYLEEQARRVELGETPDSNTQICKQLQAVIDKIIFNDDGKGNNTYKCNNHDVAYLLMCYTKKGRNTLGVAVAKHDFLRRLIMDVCYRILTNGRYDLEYKTIKVPAEKKSDDKASVKEAK